MLYAALAPLEWPGPAVYYCLQVSRQYYPITIEKEKEKGIADLFKNTKYNASATASAEKNEFRLRTQREQTG